MSGRSPAPCLSHCAYQHGSIQRNRHETFLGRNLFSMRMPHGSIRWSRRNSRMTAVSREGAEAANLGGTKQLKVPTYPGALEGPLFGKPCRGIDRRFPFHVRPGPPPHSYVRFCGSSRQLLSFKEFVDIRGFGKSSPDRLRTRATPVYCPSPERQFSSDGRRSGPSFGDCPSRARVLPPGQSSSTKSIRLWTLQMIREPLSMKSPN